MGKVSSKVCKECSECLPFLKIGRKNSLQYLELAEYGYAKSDYKDIVEEKKIEVESTASSVDSSEFLDIYSRPLELNCDKMIDKEGFLVYGQDLDEGFLVKAQWKSKFTPKEILDYFRLNNERKIWDKNIDQVEEIPGDASDEYITYTKFKKVIAISQRDMLIISNIVERNDGILVVSKSIEHEKYPESSEVTRIKIFTAGYYFEDISDDQYKTKVFSLTKANFGGSISQKFVKKATAIALPKLYQAMEKGMEKYYKIINS